MYSSRIFDGIYSPYYIIERLLFAGSIRFDLGTSEGIWLKNNHLLFYKNDILKVDIETNKGSFE